MHASPTAALGRRSNGGLNVYVREVCSHLGNLGVATDVFTSACDGECPEVEQLGPLARVVYLPAGRTGMDKYQLLDAVPEFAASVRDHIIAEGLDYDLLYSHYWLSGVAACGLRRRLGLPWAHAAHTLAVTKNRMLAPGDHPEPELRADLEGEISRCADLLVVSTAAEGDELRRAYGVRPDRIAVVPPGCDMLGFHPVPRSGARRKIGHPDDRVLLFAGRLERLKGVEVAIRALPSLLARPGHDDVRLLVLGEDSQAGGESERDRLTALVGDLGLDAKVRFLGSVPHDRLPDYYAAAEACLVPSYNESFGLVALEAQACGTPVIGSRVDGLASIVRDGLTGYLIDGHDPEEYAARIAHLLDTEGLVETMGGRAARLARGFGWERTCDGLLDHFRVLSSIAS